MNTPLTPTPTDKNTCATCNHSIKHMPVPRPWSELPQSAYTCALTNRKVSPLQTPCLLYGFTPTPRYPPPARPHPLHLFP